MQGRQPRGRVGVRHGFLEFGHRRPREPDAEVARQNRFGSRGSIASVCGPGHLPHPVALVVRSPDREKVPASDSELKTSTSVSRSSRIW